jgi:hypothetical protein
VQKVHWHHSRFIAVDLFLPARKLKVINIYCHQQNDFPSKGNALNNFVIEHIKKAERDNFKVIIMGDFNVSSSTYMELLSNGRNPEAYYGLIKFLWTITILINTPKTKTTRNMLPFIPKISLLHE